MCFVCAVLCVCVCKCMYICLCIYMCIGGGTGEGGHCPLSPPPPPPPQIKLSDVTNQQDLPLFMTDTPRFNQKLPGIASRIKLCVRKK